MEKLNKTMQEKYGVDYPLQSEEVREKMRQTCQERYGVDNPAQLPEIQDKISSTMEEHFGVKHYNELPEMREYLRNHCREWLKESWESGWQKGIPKTEEQKQKIREAVTNRINAGEWLSCGNNTYQGWYVSQKCLKGKIYWRSGYELLAMIHFDNDENVEFYDYEPFQVSYYDTENKKRHYTVDFIVKYKNKSNLLAVEVKTIIQTILH